MTSEIESAIEAAQHQAESHAAKCRAYILSNQLVEAIEYCKAHEIEPPQCSLTAQSANAHKLREKAKDMLSDAGWWRKRLKLKAIREFEQGQIKAGKVVNGISDALLEYMTTKR